MDPNTQGLLAPLLQYGAFGLCLLILYIFWRTMQYWAKRDEERQAEDKARETRLSEVIEEHQKYAREQAREISAIAVASVKAIEKSNENGTEITRVLRQIELRMGSGMYRATGDGNE